MRMDGIFSVPAKKGEEKERKPKKVNISMQIDNIKSIEINKHLNTAVH